MKGAKTDRQTRGLIRLAILLTGIGLSITVWVINYVLTPRQFFGFLLNLIPIALVAWFVGRKASLVLAAAGGILWLVTEQWLYPDPGEQLLNHANVLLYLLLFVVCAWSVAEGRRAVDALREANGRLARATEMKSVFLSAAAHDLRTPLSAIQMGAEFLAEGEAGEEAVAPGQQILEATVQMRGLLDTYLGLGRAEAGELIPRRRSVYPDELVRRVAGKLAPLTLRRRLVIRTETGESWETFCHLDPDLVEAMLTNLATNAIKHSPEGGVVRIEAEPAAPEVVFRVIDRGRGFTGNPAVLFGKYRSGEVPAEAPPGSVGLGLFLVKEIVSAHGGSVTAWNAPEGGAIVEVRLPC